LDVEAVGRVVVDAGFHIHRDLGPGLFESVYEMVLAAELERRGLRVERQKPVHIQFRGLKFDNAFRVDLLVEDQLVIELKSVEKVAPVHAKQLLTYLRLMDLRLGLLMNFGAGTFKEGCHRLVNKHEL
jgi:GxxExxY protein